jgi:hypothetical protein
MLSVTEWIVAAEKRIVSEGQSIHSAAASTESDAELMVSPPASIHSGRR